MGLVSCRVSGDKFSVVPHKNHFLIFAVEFTLVEDLPWAMTITTFINSFVTHISVLLFSENCKLLLLLLLLFRLAIYYFKILML